MNEFIFEECTVCVGTGLLSDFSEPKGTAVICENCGGKGYYKSFYTPWEGRKRKQGISSIMLKNLKKELLTYDEFEKRFPTKAYKE